jgi:hypothetical protein
MYNQQHSATFNGAGPAQNRTSAAQIALDVMSYRSEIRFSLNPNIGVFRTATVKERARTKSNLGCANRA